MAPAAAESTRPREAGRAAAPAAPPAKKANCLIHNLAPPGLDTRGGRVEPGGPYYTATAVPCTTGTDADDARMSDIVQGLLEGCQPHGALLAARRAVDINPRSADAWVGMGDVLRELERFHEAVAAYERSLEADAPPFGVLVGKAEAHAKLGQYEAAAGCYAEVLEIDPQDKDAMIGLAYCCLETARSRSEDGAARDGIDEAVTLAERAMTPTEPSIQHPFEILDILTLAGRHGDARDLADEILANDPADAETRAYRSGHLRTTLWSPGSSGHSMYRSMTAACEETLALTGEANAH